MRYIHIIMLAALIALSGTAADAQQSRRGLTAATAQLFDAVRRKDLGAARAAVAAGANLEGKDSLGLRPVDLAIDLGNFEVAHYLLSVSNLRRQAPQSEQASPPAPTTTITAPRTAAPETAAPPPALRPTIEPATTTPLPPAPKLAGPSAFDPGAVPKTFAPPIVGDVLAPGTTDFGGVAPAPAPAPAPALTRPTRPQPPLAGESKARQPEADPRLRSEVEAAPRAPPAGTAEADRPDLLARITDFFRPRSQPTPPAMAKNPSTPASGAAKPVTAATDAAPMETARTEAPDPKPAAIAKPVQAVNRPLATTPPAPPAHRAEDVAASTAVKNAMPDAIAKPVAPVNRPLATIRSAPPAPRAEDVAASAAVKNAMPDAPDPKRPRLGDRPTAEAADDKPDLLSRFTNLFRKEPVAEAVVPPPAESARPATPRPRLAPAAVSPAPTVAPPSTATEPPSAPAPTVTTVEAPAAAAESPGLLERLENLFSSSGTPAQSPSETTAQSPSGTTAQSPSGTTAQSPSGTTAQSPSGTTAPSPSGTTAPSPSKTAANTAQDVVPVEPEAPQPKPVAKAEASPPAEPQGSAGAATPDTKPSFVDRLTGWFKPSAATTEKVSAAEVAALPPPISKPAPALARKVAIEALYLGKFHRLGRSRIAENVSPDACIEKRSWNVWFCVEPVTWPPEIAKVFTVGSPLYRGMQTIVRYDHDIATQFHLVFLAQDFDKVTTYFRKQLGAPSETPDIVTPMVAAPPRANPALRWVADSPDGRAILEIRQIDDLRWVMPDTQYGVVRLYREKSESMFTLLSVSDLALARLRRPGGG